MADLPSMSHKKQVWCLKGSVAADLLRPMRGKYDLRTLAPAGKRGDVTLPNDSGTAVFLLEPNKLDRGLFQSVAEAAQQNSGLRLVAVLAGNAAVKPSNGKAPALPIFGYVTSKSPRPVVERTVEAAASAAKSLIA